MQRSASSLAAALLCLAAPFAHAAGPELIKNGTFETYTGTFKTMPNNWQYLTVKGGDSNLTSWLVAGNSVDLVKGGYGALDGVSVDLLGTGGPSSLIQSFATLIGQTYTLSFDLGLNQSSTPNKTSADLYVSFNDDAGVKYTGTLTRSNHTLNYTAVASTTTLKFTSENVNFSSGPVLDNVSVTAVPEPESYALLLAGLAVIGGIARRRSRG